MALKVIEGFDVYANADQLTTRSGYLQWAHYASSGGMIPGRIDGTGKATTIYGGAGLALTGTLASNLQTGFMGIALNMMNNALGGGIAAGRFDFSDSNSGKVQFSVAFNDDGSITTPVGRTGNNLFPNASWFFAEIGWVATKTTGRIRVRINGVQVVDVTGNFAPSTTNEWVNRFAFVPTSYSTVGLDDLYICDNAVGPGTNPCNTFLGDRRVFTLTPNGAGDLTQWTPGGAYANYAAMATNDGDTTTNGSATAGAEDLFTMTDLPSNVSQIIAVQVTGAYKKSDATSHFLTQRLKSGGVDAPGVGPLAPYALSSSYVYYSDLFMLDPNTGANWLVSAVNAAQVGYKLET